MFSSLVMKCPDIAYRADHRRRLNIEKTTPSIIKLFITNRIKAIFRDESRP